VTYRWVAQGGSANTGPHISWGAESQTLIVTSQLSSVNGEVEYLPFWKRADRKSALSGHANPVWATLRELTLGLLSFCLQLYCAITI
jgi:hypothetical protein